MYKRGLARKNSEASGNLDSGNEAPTLQRMSTFAAASKKIRSYFGASVQQFQVTCGEESLCLRIDDWEPRAEA
jgi:hypothetical protein